MAEASAAPGRVPDWPGPNGGGHGSGRVAIAPVPGGRQAGRRTAPPSGARHAGNRRTTRCSPSAAAFPDRCRTRASSFSSAHRRIADLVNPVPMSGAMQSGLPWMRARAPRPLPRGRPRRACPRRDTGPSDHRRRRAHGASRPRSSGAAGMRTRLDAPNAPDSNRSTSLRSAARERASAFRCRGHACAPVAVSRKAPRSRQGRQSLSWFIAMPSRPSGTPKRRRRPAIPRMPTRTSSPAIVPRPMAGEGSPSAPCRQILRDDARIASASGRFGLALSPSGALSRRAPGTSRPPSPALSPVLAAQVRRRHRVRRDPRTGGGRRPHPAPRSFR